MEGDERGPLHQVERRRTVDDEDVQSHGTTAPTFDAIQRSDVASPGCRRRFDSTKRSQYSSVVVRRSERRRPRALEDLQFAWVERSAAEEVGDDATEGPASPQLAGVQDEVEDILGGELVALGAVPVDDARDRRPRRRRGCWRTSSRRGSSRRTAPSRRHARRAAPRAGPGRRPSAWLIAGSRLANDGPSATAAAIRRVDPPRTPARRRDPSRRSARGARLDGRHGRRHARPTSLDRPAPGASGARPARTVSTTNRQAPACPSERTSGTFARHGPRVSMSAIGALRLGRPSEAGVTRVGPRDLDHEAVTGAGAHRERGDPTAAVRGPFDGPASRPDPGNEAMATGTTELGVRQAPIDARPHGGRHRGRARDEVGEPFAARGRTRSRSPRWGPATCPLAGEDGSSRARTAPKGRRIWTIPRILWPGNCRAADGIGVLVELSGYLAILRRWWWTLLVAAWVAGLMGYVFAGRIEPTYESSARLLVGPINSDTNTLRASSQLVQTYAELATSQGLLEGTVSRDGPAARGRGRASPLRPDDRQRPDPHPDHPGRGPGRGRYDRGREHDRRAAHRDHVTRRHRPRPRASSPSSISHANRPSRSRRRCRSSS